MTRQTALDLTRIMQAEGIQRIYMSADGRSFSVALHGGYYATGKSVGEAFEQALRDREARQSERLAA